MSAIVAGETQTDANEVPRLSALLIVGPLPPPSGGMANQTRQLAQRLAEEGFRVTVAQTNAPYRPAWIASIRGVRALFRLIPYVRNLWRAVGDAEIVHVMANSGWAWHLFAAPAVGVACLRGRLTIVNYRGGEAEKFFSRQFPLVRPVLARAAAVVVPSAFLQRVFGRRGIRTEIVPNVVDLGRFHPAPRRDARAHVVVARNLEDLYDIPTALRAFARVRARYPDARLTVAGSGPARAALERLALELGLAAAVTFSGRLDNERMAELYHDADLLLNPSRVDNMPISLLEAMASGVPIVTTNVGGIPDMVDDGKTALLVRPGDPEAMAAQALRVLGDERLADALRSAGIDAAEQYTWNAVRPRLLAVYAYALGSAGAGRGVDKGRASTRGIG